MAARILAFIVAVAMVVGAIWYRGQRDDDNGPEAGDTDVAADTPLRLVCATELQVACESIVERADERIDLTVEPAGTTADRLTAVRGSAGLEVWLTPGPWPTIVREARQRAGNDPLIQAPSAAIARARVGLVIWNDRAAALRSRCRGGQVELKCLGQAAADGSWAKSGGQPAWGDVKPGVTDPVTEAAGLAALGAGTVSFFESTDISSVDLQERADYVGWITGFARAARNGDVARMLTFGAAELDAVVSLEPLITPVVSGSARKNDVAVIYPSPVASADVLLGTVPGKRADRLTEIVRGRESREALQRLGWRAPAGSASGLPDAGLLAALRGTWGGIRR